MRTWHTHHAAKERTKCLSKMAIRRLPRKWARVPTRMSTSGKLEEVVRGRIERPQCQSERSDVLDKMNPIECTICTEGSVVKSKEERMLGEKKDDSDVLEGRKNNMKMKATQEQSEDDSNKESEDDSNKESKDDSNEESEDDSYDDESEDDSDNDESEEGEDRCDSNEESDNDDDDSNSELSNNSYDSDIIMVWMKPKLPEVISLLSDNE